MSVKGQSMAFVNMVKDVTKLILQISVRKMTHVKKSIVTKDTLLCVLTLKPMENVNLAYSETIPKIKRIENDLERDVQILKREKFVI